MMTEQLKQAFERAQQLPEKAQNMLAKYLLDELEEIGWEQIISKSQVQETLRALADKALKQYQRGEIEDDGFAVE